MSILGRIFSRERAIVGKRTSPEGARKRAEKLGYAGATMTVVMCGDEKVSKCASADAMHRSWKHLRRRAKQLRKERGVRIATIRSECLDICRFGPIVGIFPPGYWYGGCDESTLDQILDSHLDGTPPPAANRIAP